MSLKMIQKEVGPWPMNTYALICEETRTSAIIDPGENAEAILEMVSGTQVDKILITHGHFDHVQALDAVKKATSAPVYLNPLDAKKFGLSYDVPLTDGDVIRVGIHSIRAIHTPGHTPGMMCFDLGDQRIIVGDTVFVGGPGKTWSPEDFAITMKTMQNIVFQWPDETEFFPGHGPSGKIGEERKAFQSFVERGWPEELHGDVVWE